MAAFGKEKRQRAALSRRVKDVAYWENQLSSAQRDNEKKAIKAKIKAAEADVAALNAALGNN